MESNAAAAQSPNWSTRTTEGTYRLTWHTVRLLTGVVVFCCVYHKHFFYDEEDGITKAVRLTDKLLSALELSHE